MVSGEENANYEAKKVHLDNMYHMVQYCENSMDCRRAQQMAYFGEIFDRKHCGSMKKAMCDNCASKVTKDDNDTFSVTLVTAAVAIGFLLW